MRFLWIEDFDKGKGDKERLKGEWSGYFGLGEPVIREDMAQALGYLETRENFKEFDAVILDIRFPAGGEEDQVYEKYFSSIVTRELFDRYVEQGSGILLYLALVLRYGYNQERIAFVSANVDDRRLRAAGTMRRLLKGEAWGRAERELYKEKWEALKRLSESLGLRPFRELEELRPGEGRPAPDGEKILVRAEEQLREALVRREGWKVKYVTVQRQFEELGLVIPRAFEKPEGGGEEESGALFRAWKREADTAYYRFRRCALDMCRILKEEMRTELAADFIRAGRRGEEGLGVGQIRALLGRMEDILTHTGAGEGEKEGFERVLSFVREALGPGERISAVTRPRMSETRERFACRSVTKLARNWWVHQGIKGLDYGGAAFLFAAAMRAYFTVLGLPAQRREAYGERERALLDFLQREERMPGEQARRKALSRCYERLLLRNRRAYPAGETPDGAPPYQVVSGIGHQDSAEKNQVSAADLYRLFWLSVYTGGERGSKGGGQGIRELLLHTWSWVEEREA